MTVIQSIHSQRHLSTIFQMYVELIRIEVEFVHSIHIDSIAVEYSTLLMIEKWVFEDLMYNWTSCALIPRSLCRIRCNEVVLVFSSFILWNYWFEFCKFTSFEWFTSKLNFLNQSLLFIVWPQNMISIDRYLECYGKWNGNTVVVFPARTIDLSPFWHFVQKCAFRILSLKT